MEVTGKGSTFGITIAVTHLHFIHGTQQKPDAGGCVAAVESDQEPRRDFRAYFHLIPGHWMNRPGGPILLFRHMTITVLSGLFPDMLDTGFFLFTSSLSVLLTARHPCLEFGPQTAALLFPEGNFLSLVSALQAEMLSCPLFLPATYLQHTSLDMGYRKGQIGAHCSFSCALIHSGCTVSL